MRTTRTTETWALALGVLVLTALPLGAEEEDAAYRRRVDPSRTVALPLAALRLRPDVRIAEGPRLLRDTFPYLVALPPDAEEGRGVSLVPATLARVLAPQAPAPDAAPVRVPTGEAAIEAVRLFLAGPLVRDGATAERLIQTGRRLATELRHLGVTASDHRPEAWAPSAHAVRGEGGTLLGWEVSVVAFELDRMLGLVHATGRVTVDGGLDLERHAIVEGPYTTWQTLALDDETDAMEDEEAAMQAEVAKARRAYAEALRPERRLDSVWAVSRALSDMDALRALFGAPDRDVGSGLHLWVYDLGDGTSVLLGAASGSIAYARHVRGATRPLAGFETLATFRHVTED